MQKKDDLVLVKVVANHFGCWYLALQVIDLAAPVLLLQVGQFREQTSASEGNDSLHSETEPSTLSASPPVS